MIMGDYYNKPGRALRVRVRVGAAQPAQQQRGADGGARGADSGAPPQAQGERPGDARQQAGGQE
jgi:hypothetical protein